VAVEDRDTDLLPPRNSAASRWTASSSVCSRQNAAGWVEKQDARRKTGPPVLDAAIESLRSVDTSNYVLYRVRRFGEPLPRWRIVSPEPSTPDANPLQTPARSARPDSSGGDFVL